MNDIRRKRYSRRELQIQELILGGKGGELCVVGQPAISEVFLLVKFKHKLNISGTDPVHCVRFCIAWYVLSCSTSEYS